MSASSSRWLGDWRQLVEKPTFAKDVEQAVEIGSIPAFAFYFMLVMSAVIATFGLLANIAAVIIGAMIVAPLMSPIIAMSYGLVAGRGPLIIRSLLVVLTGTIVTITVAFVMTEAIGWKLAGSEIVARMRPTLLDLGVALESFSARGPFLLYFTNIVGIVFAGSFVFFWQYTDAGCWRC